MVMWCIEKRKVTRRLKSLTLNSLCLFRESLLSEMSKLRGDLNYATIFMYDTTFSLPFSLKHFPYGQHYIQPVRLAINYYN